MLNPPQHHDAVPTCFYWTIYSSLLGRIESIGINLQILHRSAGSIPTLGVTALNMITFNLVKTDHRGTVQTHS